MRIIHPLFGAALFLSAASAPIAHAGVDLDRQNAAWATQLLEATARLEQEQPAVAASIRSAEPRLSRSGAPLFVHPDWQSADAGSAILVRLADASDTPAERVGLLDALTRTEGAWHEAVVALLPHEDAPEVRRMMVEVLRLAPLELAAEGVRFGLKDAAPEVRTAALRVVGSHLEAPELGALAVSALQDPVAEVRAEAARSIGYAAYSEGFDALRSLLSDTDANVRFRTLRSLQKVDLNRARTLTELHTLATDSDMKVAREAQKLRQR